jgi:hypothetical protein
MKLVVGLGILAALLLGCSGEGSGEEESPVCDGAVHTETLSLKSDKNGSVEIPVGLDAADAAFLVSTAASRGLLSTDRVMDPDGNVVVDWEDWADSRESLTNGFYATDDVSAFNWPVREEDGALSAGDWTVVASTLDDDGYYQARQAVEVTVTRRACLGKQPTLPIAIAYAGGLERDRTVTDAVEAAAARWVEIYAAVGVRVDIRYINVDIDGSLPEPLLGGDDYAAVYEAAEGDLVVVIGDDVGGGADLYGEAGGIPGPLVASTHSAVAVSWLVHAGGDASFDDDEIEIFGETMAHEVGHYLGLYHPVETTWGAWDALSDTRRCTSQSSCESALDSNLMFPYPVCDRSCVQQTALTDGQVSVVLNNAGVR